MKRIKEYKKLFKVEGPINLKELKTAYRGLVKEWHPDKFLEEDKKMEAVFNSFRLIAPSILKSFLYSLIRFMFNVFKLRAKVLILNQL